MNESSRPQLAGGLMEIHGLKLSVTEEDLNEVLRRYRPAKQPVEDLRIALPGNAFVVAGVLPLFINVSFETFWDLTIHEGRLRAQLTQFKAMGIPANIFKSAVLKIFEEWTKKEPWLTLSGDVISADLDQLFSRLGFKIKTNLHAISYLPGQLLIEARGS